MFLLFLLLMKCIHAQDLLCCSHATGSCRTICEKVSLVEIAADVNLRGRTLQDVQRFCSTQLVSFWECLNGTLDEISRGESWPGRSCCPLPQNENCRLACVTATHLDDLQPGCRQSDEISFFNCLDRQYQGVECCGRARTSDCHDACLDIFRSKYTPNRNQRELVAARCEATSAPVLNCISNVTKVTPAINLQRHLKCCDKSQRATCRFACKETILSNNTSLQEIIDGLQVGGCGPPLPQEQFWQCLMKPETEPTQFEVKVSRIDRVGMDSAKWHCCQRAATPECRKLCSKTFTKDWSMLWEEFHHKCLSQTIHEDLRNCIDEVDEPCELGCDGLSFCTNFNNRPTELFRSCTPQADEAARNDVTLWQTQRELTLPGLNLPLKNISDCSPNTWKAVACTLQIKPCSRHAHANQICRNVCLDILTQCVDWSRVAVHHSPDSICANLSPDDPNDSCIGLDSFLKPSLNAQPEGKISVQSPCKGEPCDANETCIVARHHPSRYRCVPGCKLGEVSEYLVPENAYVRIPIAVNNAKGCLKICKCTRHGLEQCAPLPCVMLAGCWMGTSSQRQHGDVFDMDCNRCGCYAGEVVCSRKQCASTAIAGVNTAYTTLPCNCAPHYVPVCGRNGNVYPSACLAKCAGLGDADIEYGACQDPCKNNPCLIGKKCVPDTKVCLSLMHKPCTQYQCINGTANCAHLPPDPVCDIDGKQHANACLLAHDNKRLGYRGACTTHCRADGAVCGINGKTYHSECAAFADYASVDYRGPCVTVGLIADRKMVQCIGVECAPLPDAGCFGFTPPGACCPKCGGSLRLLYSRKQIDRALYVLHNRSTYPLTLKAMLQALERHVQVAQCVLRGYLTVELDIFILVESSERRPNRLQLEACVREAEKLASLINRQSPRVISDLSLSSLVAATVIHTEFNSAAVLYHYIALLVGCISVLLVMR